MKVHVSTLNQYSFCPRSVYLSYVLRLDPEPGIERLRGLLGHAIRKELCLRQSKLIEKTIGADIENLLLLELEKILEDIPYIYRNLLDRNSSDDFDYKDCIPGIRSELEGEISVIGDKLGIMIEELGIDDAIKIISPWKVEYSLRSDKLNFSGRIDKVMKDKVMGKDAYVPVEIKTGKVSDGVWEGDRLQTCAYAMLLEDAFELKKAIPFGFVEYTRVQEKRPVMTTEQLRRRVINTRDEIIDIFDGKVPGACASDRKCQSCGYMGVCGGV